MHDIAYATVEYLNATVEKCNDKGITADSILHYSRYILSEELYEIHSLTFKLNQQYYWHNIIMNGEQNLQQNCQVLPQNQS